jgi:hypothetical protein
VKFNPRTGQCDITAGGGDTGGGDTGGGDTGGGDDGGSGGGGDDGGSGGGGNDGGVVTNPVVIIDGRQCIPVGLADPQPSKSNPVWEGHTDGAIYVCLRGIAAGGGGGISAPVEIQFWAEPPPVAPPPPDPEDLARQAIASMGLHAVNIGIVPEPVAGSIGLVGMPTWMWAANPGETTVGPITRTASAGGFTVTATARLESIVWTMGDGSTVTCAGAGTPYADSYGKTSSPDCGHTYTRQGRYNMSATSYWTVAWQGIGETGTIPLDFVNGTAITMGEAQVITQ